jgi:hypothetical protein
MHGHYAVPELQEAQSQIHKNIVYKLVGHLYTHHVRWADNYINGTPYKSLTQLLPRTLSLNIEGTTVSKKVSLMQVNDQRQLALLCSVWTDIRPAQSIRSILSIKFAILLSIDLHAWKITGTLEANASRSTATSVRKCSDDTLSNKVIPVSLLRVAL